ncbi:MAG: SLC13 family permease [Bacteroidota bacterium]
MWSFENIFVFAIIAFILISLYREWIGASFTFLISVVALGAAGILTPSEMLMGFANEQIAVILMLLLLGEIIRRNSIIEIIFNRIFISAKTYRGFLAQMMVLVSSFSAFLNNTPLVAVMMPFVHSWSKKNKVSPSKLLIPLSSAAILGGCITLIGTSTNLIVNGLVIDQDIIPGMKPLGLFDFAYVGLPMMILGTLYLLYIGHKLLPSKSDVIEDFSSRSREYVVEAEVRKGSHLVGKTIEDAGLRKLNSLYLVEIVRGDLEMLPITPGTILVEGDTLYFAGDTSTIADMISPDSGLTLPEVGMLRKKKHTDVVEIVVSHNSSLINKTVKDANFRGKYDSAILAIHRNGEKVSGKIGEVRLKAGDVLLLLAGEDLEARSLDRQDFYFISKVREFRTPEIWKTVILLGGTATAILVSALGFISLFLALIILLILILSLGIVHPKDLPKSIDYDLAVIIAMSLSLGTAMIKTGVAQMIATVIIDVFVPLGSLGLLFGIYFITTILAAYITNKAAVAIVFPISLTMSLDLNLNPVPFVLVVAFAAAANFMTPIGYQTNLMVYGPGGYSFKDFFKVGFPLTIIYMIVTVFILWFIFL